MKKIVSLLLSIMLLTQPIQAMQAPAPTPTPLTDAAFVLLKGCGQLTWMAAEGTWYIASGVGSGLLDIAGRAGITETVQGAAGSAVHSTASAASSAVKGSLTLAAVPAVAYAAYWLYSARTRQALEKIKTEIVDAKNPIVPVPQRVFNWYLGKYPTAGELAGMINNGSHADAFIRDLAIGVVTNKFEGVNPETCQDDDGNPLVGYPLTQEAAKLILIQINKEKQILLEVLNTLAGKSSLRSLANAAQCNLGQIDDLGKGSYVSGSGIPLKPAISYCIGRPINGLIQAVKLDWLFGKNVLGGLEGNTFTFHYPDRLKDAYEAALIQQGTEPSSWTAAQYKTIDTYMTQHAALMNNKIKFLRGHIYYTQAATLYWDTCKKLHRIESMRDILIANERKLIPRAGYLVTFQR